MREMRAERDALRVEVARLRAERDAAQVRVITAETERDTARALMAGWAEALGVPAEVAAFADGLEAAQAILQAKPVSVVVP
jgi:hypothetical protein